MSSVLRQGWPWATAAVLVVGVWLALSIEVRRGTTAEARDERPLGTIADLEALADRDDVNLLFLLIDTLRAHRLGSYGYHRATSPTLDYLARTGIRFDRHLAQSSWTKCSMASLWTSLYPARTGVTRFDHLLPDEAVMPAEILSDAGFQSIGLYRNGWVSGYFGFDQGFEVYERPTPAPLPASVRRANPTISTVGTDMAVVEMAEEFLRFRGSERWFLYMHFMDIHEYVYDEDTAIFGTTNSDIYDNAIRRNDEVVRILLDRLREAGQLEKTVIVIASDHGEAFGERGFEGHARAVHLESTEVPFIISLPFRLDPGVVVSSRTANVDIWPTLLELLGLPLQQIADGRSRLPEIRATAAGAEPESAEPEPVFTFLDQNWGRATAPESAPAIGVALDRHRFVRGQNPAGALVAELFDADRDPAELLDMSEAQPEEKMRLEALADAYLEERPAWGDGVPTVELDEMQLNQLRALGYSLP